MIHKIYSDLVSFKALDFHSGLNILLADKNINSTEKQSRNGSGKSSFVELVHFFFGANVDSDSIFKNNKLKDYEFTIIFDLAGQEVKATRNGQNSSKVFVQADNLELWPIKPTKGKYGYHVTNEHWKTILGYYIFNLPVNSGPKKKFNPTFRTLFSYFARRAGENGFTEPTKYFDKQQLWDEQVTISYLLGLDYSIPKAFQETREKEKAIIELKKIVKQGSMSEVLENASDIKTKLTIVEHKAEKLKQQLSSFKVVPQYESLEKEASKITKEINALSNANTSDRELLITLQSSFNEEKPPAFTNLERLYEEAGVILPSNVIQRFDAVKIFHERIIENRKSHLASEIQAVETRISKREHDKEIYDKRRAEIMKILNAGGALEQYTSLQEEYSHMTAEAETLKHKLKMADQIDKDKTLLTIERAQLYSKLQDDYHERDEILREAILTFENLSTALYDKAGSLNVEAGQNGPHFAVKIDSQKSKGINNMQIFCFDFMLAELSHKHGLGPGFLIHDSHLFDGVDERQKAKAFELGHKKAKELGIQYIITMNSDDMPDFTFNSEFNITNHILSNVLSDSDNGGLFGIKF